MAAAKQKRLDMMPSLFCFGLFRSMLFTIRFYPILTLHRTKWKG